MVRGYKGGAEATSPSAASIAKSAKGRSVGPAKEDKPEPSLWSAPFERGQGKGAANGQSQFAKGRRGSGRKTKVGKRSEDKLTPDVWYYHCEDCHQEWKFPGPLNGTCTFCHKEVSDGPLSSQGNSTLSSSDMNSIIPLKGVSCASGPKHAIDVINSTSTSAMSLAETEKQDKAEVDAWVDSVDKVLIDLENAVNQTDKLAENDLEKVFRLMKGRVYDLSFHSQGCRVVQRAMEFFSMQRQVEVAEELRGMVCQAMSDSHGNHVLQKLIEVMPPFSVDFVLRELEESGVSSKSLACHKYGCRVLERLLEHFQPDRLDTFFEDVFANAKELCSHQFGNFVLGHVLEHGTDSMKRSIIEILKNNLREFVGDTFAWSVVGKALSYADSKDQLELAQAIVDIDGLVVEMANNKGGSGGHEATLRLLKVLPAESDYCKQAKQQLLKHAKSLEASKNGTRILHACDPEAYRDPDNQDDTGPQPGRHHQERRRHPTSFSRER